MSSLLAGEADYPAVFGTLRIADGLRQYRTVFVEVPVGNGKSTLAAGVALKLLFYDGEMGAEVYSAAADKDQARIVFNVAKEMVEAHPQLRERAQIFKDAIVVPSAGSVYRVLSADAFTKHGYDAHGVIFDELHAQPNRELWDVLTARTRSRRQPVILRSRPPGMTVTRFAMNSTITRRRSRPGSSRTRRSFPVIYEASPDDDWSSVKTWRKANPNFGVSVKEDHYRAQFRKAVQVPAYENTFKRFYLNLWTEQASRWITMESWDASAGAPAIPPNGAECFGGLDLASTTDIASFCLDFVDPNTGDHRAIWRHWIAAANAHKREQRDRVPYLTWHRQGFIKLTAGDVIDYNVIRKDIQALGDQYKIKRSPTTDGTLSSL